MGMLGRGHVLDSFPGGSPEPTVISVVVYYKTAWKEHVHIGDMYVTTQSKV